TGVAVIHDGRTSWRVVETRVSFKPLSDGEIAAYVASGEWRGKAGGYGIQGRAAALITRNVGSHPAGMGLPLYEAANLLRGAGRPDGRCRGLPGRGSGRDPRRGVPRRPRRDADPS